MIEFEPFTDEDGKPRARIKGGNGEIMFSSEAYEDERDRDAAILNVVQSVSNGSYRISK